MSGSPVSTRRESVGMRRGGDAYLYSSSAS